MTAVSSFERTLLTIVSTRDLMAVAILSVILYAFYYPAPYQGQTVQALPVVVVDADQSALSRAIVRHLNDTRAVRVIDEAADLLGAQRAVRTRHADGIVFLPKGFATDALDSRDSGVALWLNGTYLLRAESIGSSLTEVAQDAVDDWRAAHGLKQASGNTPVSLHPLFNTTGGYRDYVFPAVANIILQQTLLFACARLVADRRRRGVQPARGAEAIGIWGACTTIGILTSFFYFGFVFWWQDIPRMGNPWGLVLAVPPFAAAVSGLGLWLGRFFRNGDDALKALLPTSVPLVFLGGFAWPLDQMPTWLGGLAWLSPSTGAMHAFVRLNQMGASIAEGATPIAALYGLAIFYSIGGCWRAGKKSI